MNMLKNKYIISGALTVATFGILYFYYKNKINKEEDPKAYNKQMIYNLIISIVVGTIVLFLLCKYQKKELNVLTSPIDGEKPISKQSVKLPNKNVFNDINVDIMK